jgi:Alpha/beta hydrolase domain
LQSRHKLDDVVDAIAPGGSGDPFATLSYDERDGLAAVLRHGYPRGAVSQLWQFAPWVWLLLTSAQNMPYFQDFWNTPGYRGHDNRAELEKHVIDFDATVETVLRNSEMPMDTMGARMASAGAVSDDTSGIMIDVDLDDNTKLFGARIEITSGAAKGRVVPCSQVEGRLILTSVESHAELFEGVKPGDEVHVDNYDFIAWCHMFLYQLDLPDDITELPVEWRGLEAWMLDGKALHPQLPTPPVGMGEPPGGHSGVFTGKVIHVNTTHDSMVWPNGAVAWTRKIEKNQGEGRHERYRLYWGENAPHGDPSFLPMVTAHKDPNYWYAQMVSYNGLTAQALRDLVRWTEDGVEPPQSTAFEFTNDGGVVLPATAEERGGVQPLAWVKANGEIRAEVKVGEAVRFEGIAQQPPGMGSIVSTEWDFEGNGAFVERIVPDTDAEIVTVEATHAYTQPGTYFCGLRVGGHRDGLKGQGLAVENIARARVVVS